VVLGGHVVEEAVAGQPANALTHLGLVVLEVLVANEVGPKEETFL
jgi:hypothetical protein